MLYRVYGLESVERMVEGMEISRGGAIFGEVVQQLLNIFNSIFRVTYLGMRDHFVMD